MTDAEKQELQSLAEGFLSKEVAFNGPLCTIFARGIVSLLADQEGPGQVGWQPIATAPKDGTAFRAYAASLIHADFNPGGSVEAIYDGDGFIGAVWDGQFDNWQTIVITPTHWRPLPIPPVEGPG